MAVDVKIVVFWDVTLCSFIVRYIYWVFRAQTDWTSILPSELLAKELRHLPRKMPPPGTTC
jgi:hypothetical protein